jgi:hypothetical protein
VERSYWAMSRNIEPYWAMSRSPGVQNRAPVYGYAALPCAVFYQGRPDGLPEEERCGAAGSLWGWNHACLQNDEETVNDTKRFDYTQAGSLGRKELGERLRAARRRLKESEAVINDSGWKTTLSHSARAWQVFAACVELTASWGKGNDKVYLVTIADLAGVPSGKVSPILRAFHDEGVFGWNKEARSRQKGLLSLPPAEGGDLVKKPATSKQKCHECGATGLRPKIYYGEDTGLLECPRCGASREWEGATPRSVVPGVRTEVPHCPDHPDTELWLDSGYQPDGVYVAKIVNEDGSAWCCAACTVGAASAQ